MKLIDADTLNYVRARIYHDDGTIGGYNAVVPSSEIENAPTVDAWNFVYEELTKLRMFTGIYDARTSDAHHFINGVWIVMEVIAERAGHQDEFNDMFMHNVVESEERAERRMFEKAYEKAEE